MLAHQAGQLARARFIHCRLEPVTVSLEPGYAVIRHGNLPVGNRGPEKNE